MNREKSKDLLKRYNEGNASAEEIRLVERWFIQQSAIDQKEPRDVDYMTIKQQMWHHIAAGVTPVKRQHRLFSSFNIAAAAAILVIALVSIWVYLDHKNVATPQIVANDIKPGKNKAVLTLADGRKINLTDAGNDTVANEAGILITKNTEGQLVYRVVGNTSNQKTLQYNTIEAPSGGKWQVILPDGSKVFLNALSSLKYPLSFSKKERKVELNGEAYFEVFHNEKSPFKVWTKGQTVEVLGTHFNISAYADDKLVKTTLLTGSVKVAAGNNALILKPGEQSQAKSDHISLVQNVDLEDVMAWKNGYFKFNENLESIMVKVSRWYDVDISYEIKPDPEFKYKGEISRDRNLSELLSMLEFTGNAHFKIEGRRVIIKK